MALVTANLVAEWVAKRATGSGAPSNDPLTTTWADNVGSNDITLYTGSGGFAGTDSSGWDGDGSAGDPYCLVSDGTNDYGTFASSLVASDADFTIELWLYCPSVTDTNTPLLYCYKGSPYYEGFRCYLDAPNDRIVWAVANGTSSLVYPQKNETGYGAWQHHVLTYDADGDTATPYRNASAGYTGSIGFTPNTATNYLFGTSSGLAGCKIATVRVYSACLSSDDVAANYAAGILAASTDTTFMPHIMCHHFIPQQLGGH
jgi:hypothetical protein